MDVDVDLMWGTELMSYFETSLTRRKLTRCLDNDMNVLQAEGQEARRLKRVVLELGVMRWEAAPRLEYCEGKKNEFMCMLAWHILRHKRYVHFTR